jgi:hypothetical protein
VTVSSMVVKVSTKVKLSFDLKMTVQVNDESLMFCVMTVAVSLFLLFACNIGGWDHTPSSQLG